MNLISLLEKRASKHPQRLALIEHGHQVTYQELYSQVCAGSHFLQQLGLKSGDCILILQPVSIQLYITLLSTFHAGMTAMFLDPSVNKTTLRNSLQLKQPDAFIATAKAHLLRLTIPEIRAIKTQVHCSGLIPFSKKWSPSEQLSHSPPTTVEPSRPALITFTSGSTGTPKATCRTHAFLIAQHQALAEAIDLKSGEIDLVTLPIFAIANLASGMTSVIAHTNLKFPAQANSQAILSQCTEHNITRCAASPAFFQKLHHDNLFPPFQTIYTGGAPVFPHLIHSIQKAHPNLTPIIVYGSTEAEPIAHIGWQQISSSDHNRIKTGKGLLVGKPVSAVQLMIHESDPKTAIGEICVTGDHVLKSYLNGKGDHETKFTHQGKTYHRTGDMGYLDADQQLWLVGRKGTAINIGNTLTYPFGIESAMLQHPSVRNCALIQFQNKPTLCLELSCGTVESIQHDFPQFKALTFIQLTQIPMDKRHNAKVNYPQLKQILQQLHKK